MRKWKWKKLISPKMFASPPLPFGFPCWFFLKISPSPKPFCLEIWGRILCITSPTSNVICVQRLITKDTVKTFATWQGSSFRAGFEEFWDQNFLSSLIFRKICLLSNDRAIFSRLVNWVKCHSNHIAEWKSSWYHASHCLYIWWLFSCYSRI